MLTPRFAASVQGVVVQIATDNSSSPVSPKIAAACSGSAKGKQHLPRRTPCLGIQPPLPPTLSHNPNTSERVSRPAVVAVFNNLAKGADNICLELKVHCQIGIIPITDNAHTLEVLALIVYLLSRILATFLAELCCGHFVTGLAHFLLNVELNRQAVAIPTRNIWRVKT